jgi:predicted metalloprotease with PDZ domain
MIRDFAKSITDFSAQDATGAAIPYHKTDKQTWQLAPHVGKVSIEYDVYAFDLSVRSAYLDDEFAFFNGTSVFLAVEGQTDSSCMVELVKPQDRATPEWRVATTLALAKNTNYHDFGYYQAKNYEELIDHPVLMGDYDIVPFTSNDVSFELILAGGHNSDTHRIGQDLRKICHHHIQLFADTPPMERYLFITMLTGDGFGGLEHMSSTALLYGRDDLPSIADKDRMPEGYRRFLSLCSHEFFHSWHVKRIKPGELHQANLQSERYTEQLWIYEGFTSYYDDLSLQRCGVISTESYLELMGQNLTRLHRNNGRLKQTVTESSFDAWTKFYQQDASAINNIVSYYNKGAVIALCLDLLIRQNSAHQQSLDDVMRLLWTHYGRKNIPTKKNVIQVLLKEHMQIDLEDFLQSALYTTHELPAINLLEAFGAQVKFRARNTLQDKGGLGAKKPVHNALGATVTALDIGVKVIQVEENTPAFKAGLQVGDILLALNHWQVSVDKLNVMLDAYSVGQTLCLHVMRNQQMKHFDFIVQSAPKDTVFIEIFDQAKLNNWMC